MVSIDTKNRHVNFPKRGDLENLTWRFLVAEEIRQVDNLKKWHTIKLRKRLRNQKLAF